MQLVILASGRGSRLKNVTKKKPKVFVNIFENFTIYDYISMNFHLFKEIILVSGYKYDYVRKKITSSKVKLIRNYNYKTTNMVESLFLAKKKSKRI